MKSWLVLISITFISLLNACDGNKSAERDEFLQGLPADMASHLISSDDSALASYSREAGIIVLKDAANKLGRRMTERLINRLPREASRIKSYYIRLISVLSSEYNYDYYVKELNSFEELPAEEQRSLFRLEKEFYSFRSRIELPAEEKIERYLELIDKFEYYHAPLYVGLCEYEISYAYDSMGREGRKLIYLRRAARHFSESGLHEMTCPAMYELGTYYLEKGCVDSMVHYYDKAESLAHHCRLPREAAKARTLYADYYDRMGRSSLAYHLLAEAVRLCRSYKGEYLELEFIIKAMRYQAKLGCWEIVERMLRRARIVQQRYRGTEEKYLELYALQIDRMEARLRIARGDMVEAESIIHRTGKAIEELGMPYTREREYASLLFSHADGLIAAREPERALKIISLGHDISREGSLEIYSARFALLEARAAFQLGMAGRVREAIREFESIAETNETPLQCEWIERDALEGEIHLRDGSREKSILALEEGLARLKRYVINRDAGSQSYIWLSRCGSLRMLMHKVTSDDPALGYGAELVWRDYSRILGDNLNSSGTGRAGDELIPASDDEAGWAVGLFRARAEQAMGLLGRSGGIHCIYLPIKGKVRRWTASPDVIRSCSLPVDEEELRSLSDEVLGVMSGENSEIRGKGNVTVRKNLRKLAGLLLPKEVVDTGKLSPNSALFITAGSFLERLPFEALNLGEQGEYIPLLMRHDVAYLRYAHRPEPVEYPESGLVLANAGSSNKASNPFPFHSELQETSRESEQLVSSNPSTIVLEGAEATKTNLLSRWESVSSIYMATHMLRDPQVPYLALIPLASPPEADQPERSYLDITDIRSADLSRCRLVVLSGCSSGAPYLKGTITGPSLGDAFLDAGARSVIFTFWDIPDREAARLMTLYIERSANSDSSPTENLCRARRDIYLEAGKNGNGFGWASYAIKTGEL